MRAGHGLARMRTGSRMPRDLLRRSWLDVSHEEDHRNWSGCTLRRDFEERQDGLEGPVGLR